MLSGLDAGKKHAERDLDDDTTLMEIMEKKRVLEEKKRELVEQATAALATKKSKLQKETPPAPSESEIDLGVFSAKHGNLLEKIFAASGSLEGGGDTGGASYVGAGAGTGGGGDVVVEESSEATLYHTVYTKVVWVSGQGGASGTHHSLEYEHVQGGSWDTHNSACADLPHAPWWNLTQGSRMTELANCREFFSLSLPPAERLFQKRRNRLDLLDDHIHAGVNFFATSQEISREWQLMGEDILEFENAKKALAEEREKFDAERKGC
ncbi:hypothetical protein Hdeb2414_s0006g00219561 [Helianthus debilis subsp. tardiflorus]